MNYYNEIKNKLIDNEIYEKVKDYSKERHRVLIYFEIGKLLNEAGGKYGDKIIEQYSKRLVVEVGKKYNKRTLFRMKQFYTVFSAEKVSTLLTQLSWSHYLLLLSIKNYDEIIYYINISRKNNLTQRQLQERIKNNEYYRLSPKTRENILKFNSTNLEDLVLNPIVIKNNKNYEVISEKMLQALILENITSFLKELGPGFTYIENEYRIKLGTKYNYIDLLLYNIKHRCYVVVELKITTLKKEHIGQILICMNYIDEKVKTIEDNKTVGIIICKENNKYIIKYCSDKRIISREYKLL